MASTCPFCHISLPSYELEWHANSHFMEDDLVRDMELAQQIAVVPENLTSMDKHTDILLQHEVCPPECSTSRTDNNESNCLERLNQMVISLVKFQNREIFYEVEGGIMRLLTRCLEKENKSTSVVTGYIDHYQSASKDISWGCGWRNIQMLSSHVMAHREEVRAVIFGGLGVIPDIPSLQRWLEIAWEKGFDIPGADLFGYKIHGSKKWIGTTECAALLRSFGLRARVVDFDGKSSSSSTGLAKESQGKACVKMKSKQVYGPMDKFLIGKRQDSRALENEPVLKVHSCSSPTASYDISQQTDKLAKEIGPQILANWVWNYFMDAASCGSASSQNVLVTQKTPLYFQHDGHSRTIVGIQRLKRFHGMPDQYTLLILDPGQRTAALGRALRENFGWQRMVKRGVHTLRKPQYQLCYVDPGIAKGEELNQLKRIDSILVEM